MNWIFAIDPGPEQSGFCWLNESGLPGQTGVTLNHDLLETISTLPDDVDLVIEMVTSYGRPVGRTVFETCVWIGRFQQASPSPEHVHLVARDTVRLSLCRTKQAKPPHVWQALVDRFGPPGRKANPGPLYGIRSHARAALALAATYYDQRAEHATDESEGAA